MNQQYQHSTVTSVEPEKSGSFVLGFIGILIGAFIGAGLYLLMSRLGRFSLWAAIVGVFLSRSFFSSLAKKERINVGTSFLIILVNLIALVIAELLDIAFALKEYYNSSFGERIKLAPEVLMDPTYKKLYLIIALIICVVFGIIFMVTGLSDSKKNAAVTRPIPVDPSQDPNANFPASSYMNPTQNLDGHDSLQGQDVTNVDDPRFNRPEEDFVRSDSDFDHIDDRLNKTDSTIDPWDQQNNQDPWDNTNS